MWVVREAAVRMAEEMPSAVVASVPNAHRVVAQHDNLRAALELHRHLEQVVHFLEERRELRPGPAVGEAWIVIPKDEHHVPASDPGAVRRGIAPTEAEVAQVVEPVIGADTGVDAIDDCGVHSLDVRKRPAAVLDDVGVAQVGVCREEDGHVGFLDHSMLAALDSVP